MKHAPLIALLVVLVGGAIGLATFLSRDSGEDDLAADDPKSASTTALGGEVQLEALEAADAVGADPAREVARSTDTAFDTEGARWVNGRVVLAPSCPVDETLEVFALDEPRQYRELVRALDASDEEFGSRWTRDHVLARGPVGPDGEFRLPFPEGKKVGHVLLRGRYLYLGESVAVTLGPQPATVALTPLTGTFLRGRLTAPESAVGPAADLAGIEVVCRTDGGQLTPAMGMVNTSVRSAARTEPDGRFEFRALPTSQYAIYVTPEHLAAVNETVEASVACTEATVVIPLKRGGDVSGHVVDEGGQPIAGANVEALLTGRFFGFDDLEARTTETDGSGAFRLTAVPSGGVSVRAESDGRIESKKHKVQVPEQGVVDGLIIELGEGQSIAGTVTRVDGTPASSVKVTVSFDPAYMAGPTAFNALRGASGEAQTDAEGRFRVAGLGGGPFIVSAAAPPPGDDREGEDGHERRGWEKARRDGVQVGAQDLLLVLHPPMGLHGIVRDLEEQPVLEFRVTASRVVSGPFGETGLESRDESFETEDGRFLMEDMLEGRWKLSAESEGFLTLEPSVIELPAASAGDPVVLTMTRAATISGVVHSPDGRPVSGAEISVDTGKPQWQEMIAGGQKPAKTRSEEDGTFVLTGVVPEQVGIHADAEDYARGPAVTLDLAPGESVADVELRLITGGTLTGEVYDKDGKRAVGRMITVNQVETFENAMAMVDGEGEFRLEHLSPGSYQVISMDRGADWSGSEEGFDMGEMIGSMQMTQAQITDGVETHVVLGAPPEDPVAVRGKVTHGDEPYRGALISFYPEGGKIYERMKFESVGQDGRYELLLDGPGDYVVNIQMLAGGPGQQNTIEFAREIPEGSEYELDFEIPLGRISGTVSRADGTPAGGARITLVVDSGARSDQLFGGQYTEIQANQDGRYDVEGLRPDTYRVSAGGASFFGSADSGLVGRVTRGGLALGEDEWMQGVDFRLPEPGSIEVIVADADGNPASGAALFLRDTEERISEPFSFITTDSAGKATSTGIAPGEYTVVARLGLSASVESPPVRVTEGQKSKVALRLETGTILWIRLRSREDGEDLSASVRVLDSDGREMGGMFSMADLQALYIDGGFSPTEHRVGPLPPGKYKIFAKSKDGLETSKPVTLKGEPERKITLRLK